MGILVKNYDQTRLYGNEVEKYYLTFEALEDCTFTFIFYGTDPEEMNNTISEVSYSVDNGATWVSKEWDEEENSITTPTVKKGDKVLWKGNGFTNDCDYDPDEYCYFTSTGGFNVYGNIMSLVYGDDFFGKDTIISGNTFTWLFAETPVVSAEYLVLPTTLAKYCYISMFSDCYSLTTAPTLPATILAPGCYEGMFSDCESLNYIKMLATDISATTCLSNWISSETTGTLIINKDYDGTRSALNVPATWTILNEDGTPHIFPRDYSEEYFTIEVMNNETGFNFTIPIEICENDDITEISYSVDNGNTWTTINNNYDEILIEVQLNAGEKILLKGIANKYSGILSPEQDDSPEEFYSNIYVDDDYIVYGNIMSLFYGDNFLNKKLNTNYTYHCAGLFNNNDCLIDASNLIFPTNILTGSYLRMFQNCTSLTTAPSILPATTLAKYCYYSMFQGCSSLNTVPVLPATNLSQKCYDSMFNGCTSLVNAPELPATTLVKQCYYSMFRNCTSLTTAPVLPAITLVSGCYYSMFRNCTNLNYIKAMFTTTPNGSYTGDWVNGVAQDGTFVKNSAATWTTTGLYAVPTGWTVETE